MAQEVVVAVHYYTLYYLDSVTWNVPSGRHLAVRPEYLNPGVIAHEQAHNSYALLTDADKTQFAAKLAELRKSDEMVKYLYKVKKYAIHDSDIEAHAEIYRYVNVPDEIKQYYPRLFVEADFLRLRIFERGLSPPLLFYFS